MRQYFRLVLVVPLRSPLLSALPFTARLPMVKHSLVPFLGGMVHARTSSGTATTTSTPPTRPTVDAEVRAQEAELHKAVLRKAEAKALMADIEAGKAKATADIELGAAKARAEVDAAKAKIELEEATTIKASASKAKAKADLIRQCINAWESLRSFLPWVMGLTLLGGLALDYYVHESKDYIRRCMLSKLRECKPPAQLSTPPSTVLSVAQEPLTLGFLPTLLLGPLGSGKSTLLGSIALSLPKPAPVVLVRLRLPANSGAATFPVSEGNMEGKALMDAAAFQVFSQIGFPVRRSLIVGIFLQGFTLMGDFTKIALSSETSNRLVTALVMLFDVCGELKEERQKTMGPLDAAPILLFDEVQDLIKDERLRKAGGQLVLDMLGALLVGYCVDRRAVRAVVAGSSAELYFAFAACSPLHNARWKYYDLKDPGQAAVIAALKANGYTTEEALSMVELCGTRLRLLEVPLTEGKSRCSAAHFLSSAHALGRAAFAAIFSKLSKADAAQLCKLLDSIEACEAAQDAAAQKGAAQEVPARPTKDMLPAALIHADVAPILFVTREKEYLFQSQLHRRTWQLLRSKYRAQT